MVEKVDYKGMTAGEFHTSVGMDGAKWTEAFKQHFPQVFEHMEADGHTDFQGTMLGWFCNAIMAGYGKARAKYSLDEKAMREKFGLPDPEINEGQIGLVEGMRIVPASHAEDLKDGTRLTLSEFKINPELDELLRKAADRVKKMTPEERAEMFRQQKISWVYGEIGIENPNSTITREDVARMVDEQYIGRVAPEVDNAIEDIVEAKVDDHRPLDFASCAGEIGEIVPPIIVHYTTDLNDPNGIIMAAQTYRVPAVGELQTFYNDVENVASLSEDMHTRLNNAAGRVYEVTAIVAQHTLYEKDRAETIYRVLLEDVTDEYASSEETESEEPVG